MSPKSATKRWLAWIKEYAKRHTFHMMVLVALVILGIIQVTQYAMIGSVYGLIQMHKQDYESHLSEYEVNRETDKQFMLDSIEAKGQELSASIENTTLELNSRIDILDSAIQPEEKRRMLIVKVRKAITDNTETKLSIRELNNISIAVIDYSYQYNLSIARVLAQIKQESNFNIKAKSHAGAMGLMQVIPETWEWIRVTEMDGKTMDPYNIYHNIRSGCYYMSEQVLKFGNYSYALMAYNWGPHRVRELIAGDYTEENIPKETKGYVVNINQWIQVFEQYGLE